MNETSNKLIENAVRLVNMEKRIEDLEHDMKIVNQERSGFYDRPDNRSFREKLLDAWIGFKRGVD